MHKISIYHNTLPQKFLFTIKHYFNYSLHTKKKKLSIKNKKLNYSSYKQN